MTIAYIDLSKVQEKILLVDDDRFLMEPLKRIVSDFGLEVDTAYISKLERGEKNIRKNIILKLASFYDYDKNELISLFYCYHSNGYNR